MCPKFHLLYYPQGHWKLPLIMRLQCSVHCAGSDDVTSHLEQIYIMIPRQSILTSQWVSTIQINTDFWPQENILRIMIWLIGQDNISASGSKKRHNITWYIMTSHFIHFIFIWLECVLSLLIMAVWLVLLTNKLNKKNVIRCTADETQW